MAAVFFLLLGIFEYLVFSDSFSQYFQGDALFYMSHRFRSWGEFFHALGHLDIANWYRPLASQTIPSVFFPWFGLNPYGYHWVVFLVFFATTCLVFWFLQEVSHRFVVAAVGTVFFSIHSMNVYPTYDFAFAPEMFYASFYLLSCIAFLRRRHGLALVFFVLALMSKEPAVTLAGNIVLLMFFFARDRDKKLLLPFFGIFAIYYLYVVRFMKVGAGDYAIALHKDLVTRIGDSFLWAFNLFRGRMPLAVVIAALFVAAYAVASMFSERRRYTLFGLGWFLVALSPMLGIVGYFGPYYLFLPLVGIALIVGESFEWLYTTVLRFNKPAAYAVVCLGLAPFVIAARTNAQAELYTNTALGYAGRIAENSARDLKRAHPTIPKGATVYLINPDQPDLTRYYGINGLVKLLYDDDTIDVRYSSLGHALPDDRSKLIVMRYAEEGLVTADAREVIPAKTEDDFQYTTSDQYKFEVSPPEVALGKGSMTIRVAGAPNTDAELQYRYNEGSLAFLTIHLNPAGETKFFVSNETKLGTYRFVGMRILPGTTWIRVAGSVKVSG